MSVEEFLAIEIEHRAELIDGILYMMTGGSFRHAAISRNVLVAIAGKLRGGDCEAIGPDFGVRTGPASVRFPDVSVYCGMPRSDEQLRAKLAGDPKLVVEVLSPTTRHEDEKFKLPEYRSLPGLEVILFIDPETRRVRLVERAGPESWTDAWLAQGSEVPLRALGMTLSAKEVFGSD